MGSRVLIVITTDFVGCGGLTTVVMNYLRNMSLDGLTIDIASTNKPLSEDIAYKDIINMGCHYYCLGSKKRNPILYVQTLKKLLIRNQYDIIHVHGNSSTMALELSIAKRCGVKKRISHGHTTRSNYPLVNFLLKPLFRRSYTDAIAVSNDCGKWLYGDQYVVYNNAIDLDKFAYNIQARKEIREELNIPEKCFVIGTVGKLNANKNHMFLIDVFSKYLIMNKKACLVIVGGGAEEQKLKMKCNKLGIGDHVMFLGMRNDISNILSAFDAFVFTSKFEGLGMVLVEAQANGLPCISSDCVPKETNVTNYIRYLSLNDDPLVWCQAIVDAECWNRREVAIHANEKITKSGFNIKREAYKLKEIYK